ncbi:hypothetical protein Y695_03878 [Hydrogenophaga sp. T4]|nr:hypothetical protein Y695_03878 [Hydrogenophaga sp. T4]
MLSAKATPAITSALASGSTSPWPRYSQVLSPSTTSTTPRLRTTARAALNNGSASARTSPAITNMTSS